MIFFCSLIGSFSIFSVSSLVTPVTECATTSIKRVSAETSNALDVSADTLLIDVVAHSVTGVTNELTEKIEKLPIKEQKKIIKVIHTLLEE